MKIIYEPGDLVKIKPEYRQLTAGADNGVYEIRTISDKNVCEIVRVNPSPDGETLRYFADYLEPALDPFDAGRQLADFVGYDVEHPTEQRIALECVQLAIRFSMYHDRYYDPHYMIRALYRLTSAYLHATGESLERVNRRMLDL